jgi:hypothetical protein
MRPTGSRIRLQSWYRMFKLIGGLTIIKRVEIRLGNATKHGAHLALAHVPSFEYTIIQQRTLIASSTRFDDSSAWFPSAIHQRYPAA